METLNPFFLDIETRGDKRLEDIFFEGLKAPANIKDEDKIEAALEKKREAAGKDMAVDADFNEIICIGVKVVDEPPVIFKTLREFVDWYNAEPKDETGAKRSNRHRMMVTFNGNGFDLPVLIKQAIKQDMQDFPYTDFIQKMDRYKGRATHIDLMNEVAMVWGKNKSLDKYLQIYLGISKTEIDFATASDEEIISHCREDIENTEKLFKKFSRLWYTE